MVLGGVGSKSVEEQILRRFPGIDVICRGEGELTAPDLLGALRAGRDLDGVARHQLPPRRRRSSTRPTARESPISTPSGFPPGTRSTCAVRRLRHDDQPRLPVSLHVLLGGARCGTLQSHSRAARNIVARDGRAAPPGGRGACSCSRTSSSSPASARSWSSAASCGRGPGAEMEGVRAGQPHRRGDDAGDGRLRLPGTAVRHRVRLATRCWRRSAKGFTAAEVLKLVPKAIGIFPRVDTFYVWGFPFETMDDFDQSLFQMVSFRMMGPGSCPACCACCRRRKSTASWADKRTLEFCPGCCRSSYSPGTRSRAAARWRFSARARGVLRLIQDNPDIFPGFFHMDLKNNVLPKLAHAAAIRLLSRVANVQLLQLLAGQSEDAAENRRCAFPAARPRNSRQPRPK